MKNLLLSRIRSTSLSAALAGAIVLGKAVEHCKCWPTLGWHFAGACRAVVWFGYREQYQT